MTENFDGRNLGHRSNDSPLQTLILRDCFSLQEREVVEFLNSLIGETSDPLDTLMYQATTV